MLKREMQNIRKALMSGVGYMIPFVVFGGIFIAAAIALSGIQAGEGVIITNPILQKINQLGEMSMNYMVPILAAFISYGLADRGGIMPGMIGGTIAMNNGAGFLGGILAGILAGYIVNLIKKIPVHYSIKALMPIFIIPLLGGISVALIMEYIITAPLESINMLLTNFLSNMRTGNAIILAIILGVMTAFDMGGPLNVVACLFSWSLFSEGIYTLAGPVAVAICTPSLGMGLATLLSKKKYSDEDREAGKAALAMGMIGISEGAIPFAAKDPFRVLPSICVGGAVGAVVAMVTGVATYAPHGGPIVIFVTEKKFWFALSIVIGSVVTALMVNALKKDYFKEEA